MDMLLIKGSLFVTHKYITGWLSNESNVTKIQANIYNGQLSTGKLKRNQAVQTVRRGG